VLDPQQGDIVYVRPPGGLLTERHGLVHGPDRRRGAIGAANLLSHAGPPGTCQRKRLLALSLRVSGGEAGTETGQWWSRGQGGGARFGPLLG